MYHDICLVSNQDTLHYKYHIMKFTNTYWQYIPRQSRSDRKSLISSVSSLFLPEVVNTHYHCTQLCSYSQCVLCVSESVCERLRVSETGIVEQYTIYATRMHSQQIPMRYFILISGGCRATSGTPLLLFKILKTF